MSAKDELLRVMHHQGAVNTVRLTEDGSYCMTGSADRTLKLWNPHKSDLADDKKAFCVQTYKGVHGYSVLSLAIFADKSRFVSAGEDRTVYLWDVASCRVIRRIQAHYHPTNSVAVNTDGTVVFTASYDQTIKCWDLRAANSHEPIQVLNQFKDSVTTVRYSDGLIYGGSVDGTVRTFDMRQGCVYIDHMGTPVVDICPAVDNLSYFATCLQSKLRYIDLPSSKQLKEYQGAHSHHHYKSETALESSGRSIVTGSEDGSIGRYDIISGDVLSWTKHAHLKAISSIQAHPSSDMVITASHDSTAKVWSVTRT